MLQSTIPPSLQHHHNLVSVYHSNLCSCPSIPIKLPSSTLHLRPTDPKHHPLITCSISQVHTYGTMDYERRPAVKWNAIYRRISLMENSDLGSASVLNQCENEGKKFTKWELCRVVKELRKYRRYKLALEVYDWMNNRGERFRLSTSDVAIQLDLISKVHGISSAEEYFQKVPDAMKDNRIYGAVLNAYAKDRNKEKVEFLIEQMKNKGYASHALPFNVVMTLYMNLKEYDMVDSTVSEMMHKNIQLDIYSYNIWLSSCGSQGSIQKMERVYEQMKTDRTINPNWTTFSTMATMYTKQGQFEKATECLKIVESRIAGRDRIPYHYLLSLYGTVGNKEEVFRIWNIYKSIFPTIPNMGYHAMISSLVRIGDIKGAEEIYEQWLLVKTTYDPRIANLLIGWYIKEGIMDKAINFLEHIIEQGGKPNSSTWEVVAQGHIGEGRIPDALSCLKEAFSAEGSKNWKPKPDVMSAFLQLCEQESDIGSKEILVGLLKQKGYLENEMYNSLIGTDDGATANGELSKDKDETDNGEGNVEDESDELILGQLERNL